MNLYQLTGTALYLQDMLEAGEIDQEVFDDTIDGLDIDTKIENICKVIRNLETQAKAFKEEKDRLAERERVAKNGVSRLKESLLAHMNVLNKKKIEAGLFAVTKSQSTAVKVFDETGIPEEFLVYHPATIDKVALGKALKENKVIAGAKLEVRENVRIR